MALTETYEKASIHDRWQAVYRQDADQFNESLLDRILEEMSPAPEALFLDAGCGSGDHAVRLARRGYRVVAVDLSQAALSRAKENVERAGLDERIALCCESLEDLANSSASFDAIHCRGVLMHIPDWERCLASLCRVLKPGGRLVILEANTDALETRFVLLVRRFLARRSRVSNVPGGIEFWSEFDGTPFLVRVANIPALIAELADHQVVTTQRIGSEFWDINRFPRTMRRMAILFNQLCLRLHLPARVSMGNAVIARKR